MGALFEQKLPDTCCNGLKINSESLEGEEEWQERQKEDRHHCYRMNNIDVLFFPGRCAHAVVVLGTFFNESCDSRLLRKIVLAR